MRRSRGVVLLVALALAGSACSTSSSTNTAGPGGSTRPLAQGAAGTGVSTGATGATRDPSALTLEAVSTRAEYVTGGDVVVAIHPPAGSTADPSRATVTVNGA